MWFQFSIYQNHSLPKHSLLPGCQCIDRKHTVIHDPLPHPLHITLFILLKSAANSHNSVQHALLIHNQRPNTEKLLLYTIPRLHWHISTYKIFKVTSTDKIYKETFYKETIDRRKKTTEKKKEKNTMTVYDLLVKLRILVFQLRHGRCTCLIQLNAFTDFVSAVVNLPPNQT